MRLSKAKARKLKRLIDAIFEECPNIHLIERGKLGFKVNGLTPNRRIFFNPLTRELVQLTDDEKSWLVEAALKAEEVAIFHDRVNCYISGEGYGDFSFARKKKGA